MTKEVFNTLNQLDVNEHVERKDGLSYLTWSWAVAEVSKRYPDWNYEIVTTPDGLPYVYDEKTGYLVRTRVTIEGCTKEMWLPVMDGANKAMFAFSYKYTTKYGEKSVAQATMFDINKTIMRCLVKNLAMFGLGLYIYAGEDLPEKPEEVEITKENVKENPKGALKEPKPKQTINLDCELGKIELDNLNSLSEKWRDYIFTRFNVKSYEELTRENYDEITRLIEARRKAKESKQ